METGSELLRIGIISGLLIAGGVFLALFGGRKKRERD
jgi:hypothetical protein